jgi:DNA-3-methyladenine glycosylase
VVRERRATPAGDDRLLTGPGNLCRGLAITAADNGLDLCSGGRIRLEQSPDVPVLSVGPRVGISRAADLPLRFWWTGHPAVSGRLPTP